MTTVVIPAHNEGRVIRRLLEKLINGADPGETDIIVVANGCTDDTAEVAASFGPAVRVLTVPAACKQEALRAGDRAAAGFPRIYVDADLELRIDDIRALAAALSQPGVLAAAPRRELVMAGRPWQVRWYYDVWTLLPGVQRGLWGRGVIAVNEAGHRRLAGLPPLQADDLAASLMFEPHETALVPAARVIIHPPRTFARPAVPQGPLRDRGRADRTHPGSGPLGRPDADIRPDRHHPAPARHAAASRVLPVGGRLRPAQGQPRPRPRRLPDLAA